MKTIVALVDFSDVTPKLIEHARAFAQAFGSQVVILHVVPEEPSVVDLGLASPTIMQSPSEKRIEADYNQLLSLRDTLAAAGVNVSVQQLDQGSVGKVIELCGGLVADLIMVGAHHHSRLYHLFIGTFASDVLKRSHVPVLVVPA